MQRSDILTDMGIEDPSTDLDAYIEQWREEIKDRRLNPPKPDKPARLETYLHDEIQREHREANSAEQAERKQALRSKFERDLWDSLSASDAKRFASLNIDAAPGSKPMLSTVPQKKRHAAIIACMYHIGQYYRQKGKLTPETAPEKLQRVIFDKVKSLQDELAVYRTKYGAVLAFSDPGPIKSDDELLRLAGYVAKSILERPWTQDIDACKRGGKQSGRVRHDKAEATTWAEVRRLAKSVKNKSAIARQVGIHRNMVSYILSQPQKWGRSAQ